MSERRLLSIADRVFRLLSIADGLFRLSGQPAGTATAESMALDAGGFILDAHACGAFNGADERLVRLRRRLASLAADEEGKRTAFFEADFELMEPKFSWLPKGPRHLEIVVRRHNLTEEEAAITCAKLAEIIRVVALHRSEQVAPAKPKQDGPAEQAAVSVDTQKQRRRGTAPRKPRPLTGGKRKSFKSWESARGLSPWRRQLGRDRKTVAEIYKAAMAKLGKSVVRSKDKTRLLPRDKRGQEAVSDADDMRG